MKTRDGPVLHRTDGSPISKSVMVLSCRGPGEVKSENLCWSCPSQDRQKSILKSTMALSCRGPTEVKSENPRWSSPALDHTMSILKIRDGPVFHMSARSPIAIFPETPPDILKKIVIAPPCKKFHFRKSAMVVSIRGPNKVKSDTP